jgi:hypothetical protein
LINLFGCSICFIAFGCLIGFGPIDVMGRQRTTHTQPTHQSTRQQTNQTNTYQAIDKSTYDPTNQSTNTSSNKSTNKQGNK